VTSESSIVSARHDLPLFAGFFLLAGIAAAAAALNISSSELPGRDRQRFLESPVERFMQPTPRAEPLIQRRCESGKPQSKRSKKSRTRAAAC